MFFTLLLHFTKPTLGSLIANSSRRNSRKNCDFLHGSILREHAVRSSPSFVSSSSSTTILFSTKVDKNLLIEKNELSSAKSSTAKMFKAITSKKQSRTESSATLLEGIRLVTDALSHPPTRTLFRHVLVTKHALQRSDELGCNLSYLLSDLDNESTRNNSHNQEQNHQQQPNCRVDLVSDSLLRTICDTVNPQGVAAIVGTPPSYTFNPDRLEQSKQNTNRIYLILDGVSDPGNVGTLLRSSLAVGVEAVIVLPDSCDVWSPKAVRSAMGATFRVPLRLMDSWEHCLQFMEQQCGVSASQIYAATMEDSGNDSSLSYYEVDWCGKSEVIAGNCESENGGKDDSRLNKGIALCIGKEGPGLSQPVRNAVQSGCIRSVHVPMETGVESLNAAVCGSVILFEYLRQAKLAAIQDL